MSGSAEILPTHTPALFRAAVERAAAALRAGELVAVPTETVYGLAANAFDTAAVSGIFAAKGRPAHNPIIVHVASLPMARRCAAHWPAKADALAAAFWPGPLTMVLPRSHEIPDVVTAGGPTVGIRWPAHPFMQELIHACRFPLAAPSANLANTLSPTNASHVATSLGKRVALIVDGGQCQVGIESTVLDLTVIPPCLLRPGMVHEESLVAVVGELRTNDSLGISGPILRSPGQLPKHYAPKARLLILNWSNDGELIQQLSRIKAATLQPSSVHVIAHTHIPSGGDFGGVSVIPHDAEAYARAIYAELHRCDEAGAQWIVVESLPATSQWRALADRLQRASSN